MYYLTDEPGMHFIWQPSQEPSVLSPAKDCGVISAPEVTQRRTDNNDHSPSSG
jgi:hypothetical protein